MTKIGSSEEPILWTSLTEVRTKIDALYEEKMQLVNKMFRLGVKFCQELQIQNQEQMNHIRAYQLTQAGQSGQQSILDNDKGTSSMSQSYKYRVGQQLGSLESGLTS